MSAAIELPGLVWRSPGAAYAWAEEESTRPDCKSPAAVLMHHMVGGIGGRASQFGPRDFRDLAHTVLAAVAGIQEPYAREAFRYVHGQYTGRAQALSSTVAEHVSPHYKLSYSKVYAAALVATRRIRTDVQDLHGRRMGLAWYARALGLAGKASLYKGPWMELIEDCERDFRDALSRGRRAARQAMEEHEITLA